ncbi:BspA family leucine-rich repeat surface protein [Wenyingzhuangia sp. chi5]|uniref:BspA family leucine-rich repeat surface protein n=1 Tax=Wenyingzhuangia gilva TaxID=3057677 RepID=A0ABT8VUM8_9FLAO|nr:BspA family leucine-rich repeat surface protein [Wenyingzhuangia sp. chi5]MDO3695668.1 BspA family leucine-rich repeat surface protein [Wenyingzhuangia sp. chi5]
MKKTTYLFCILFYVCFVNHAQINNNGILTNPNQSYINFTNESSRVRSRASATIPMLSTGAVSITFTLRGGDGGTATWDGAFTDLVARGGEGGSLFFTMPITEENQGKTFTFYQGKRGESNSHSISASGGGGGSTALIDHNGNLIAIAGGGGGGAAVENYQSDGRPGGIATDGHGSCGNTSNSKGDYGKTGKILNMYLGDVSGHSSTKLYLYAGAGAGLNETSPRDFMHSVQVTGKTADNGGLGGHHPVETFYYGTDCGFDGDGNPFTVTNCFTLSTKDLSAGGAGYSGGGAGSPWLKNSGSNSCTDVMWNLFGGGGGGAGHTGGGAGGRERGGGGGSSYILPEMLNKTEITGSYVNGSRNGVALYQVNYDNEKPVAVCKDVTLPLGRGNYITNEGNIGILNNFNPSQTPLTPEEIDGGSTDNGVIASLSASKTLFSCNDLGTNIVTLTVKDASGNTSTCSATVTVIDDFAPTITQATSNIINATNFGKIDLELETSKIITPPNLEFTDNCGVASIVQAEPFTVTCADIGTTITKEVIATDTSGNKNVVSLKYTIYSSAATPKVIYVNAKSPNDTGDGLSWFSAKKHLNSALALIDSYPCSNQTQIWVAAGTYYPDEGTNQVNNNKEAVFLMNGIEVYGGFTGNETTIEQRDLLNNKTILSGEIQQNNDYNDNAYHVIASNDSEILTVIDGFTITGGNANGTSFVGNYGGGAIFITTSGIFRNCIILGNSAYSGGGVYNIQSNLSFINCIISGNLAQEGGGVYNLDANSSFINCTLSGNSAYVKGGAIFNYNSIETETTSLIQNTIIWNNRENGATNSAGASVSGNATYNKSLVANRSDSGIIYNEDPNFAKGIDLTSTTLPTTTGDFHTSLNSIVDKGDKNYNNTTKDLEGKIRIYGYNIDLGPYENGADPSLFVITVRTTTPNERIDIPVDQTKLYFYLVDWENDGIRDSGATNGFIKNYDGLSHVYPNPGIHTLVFKTSALTLNSENSEHKDKLLSVEQWGDYEWTSMNKAFAGCSNLEINATDVPDLSSCTDLSYMFSGIKKINSDISTWDVSNVTNMEGMFNGVIDFIAGFNKDISTWDVSNVTNMNNMLNGAKLSVENYDKILTAWSQLSLQNNVIFNVGSSQYCTGIEGRNTLTEVFGWTITDGGYNNCTLSNFNPELLGLTFYPNPVSSVFTINNPSELFLENIEVYNVSGNMIKNIQIEKKSKEVNIDVSSLTPAVYFIKIKTTNGGIVNKLIKK